MSRAIFVKLYRLRNRRNFSLWPHDATSLRKPWARMVYIHGPMGIRVIDCCISSRRERLRTQAKVTFATRVGLCSASECISRGLSSSHQNDPVPIHMLAHMATQGTSANQTVDETNKRRKVRRNQRARSHNACANPQKCTTLPYQPIPAY